MAKKAHVKCNIQCHPQATQERFEWYFSDSPEGPDISSYNAGVITTATMLCNPNTTVTLKVFSIRGDEEIMSEVSLDVPSAPEDEPSPEALGPSVLGPLTIFEWVNV